MFMLFWAYPPSKSPDWRCFWRYTPAATAVEEFFNGLGIVSEVRIQPMSTAITPQSVGVIAPLADVAEQAKD